VTPPGAHAQRWWALGAVLLAIVAVGVESTVLSVALPTLSISLHASESDLQWVSARAGGRSYGTSATAASGVTTRKLKLSSR
jgi:hypothetical protein